MDAIHNITYSINERGFACMTFVSGSHDHERTRVWVHHTFVSGKEQEIAFPMKKAKIYQTQKGSLVLRPGKKEENVYYVEIPSGYRGSADISDIKSAEGRKVEIVAKGYKYHSGRGALGETAWALINSDGEFIEVYGRRSGRRIDNPKVEFKITSNGKKEELIDEEVCNILKIS